MTILLKDICVTTHVNGKSHVLFDKLNLHIGLGDRIGVLGLPKSGKSTLLRIVCGTQQVDEGEVFRDMTCSWPIPTSNFVWPQSSIAWNIRSIARIYGVSDPQFVHRVGELGGVTEFLDKTLPECPPYVRPQLGFGLGIGMDFDLYLFDNQAVPPRKEFKDSGLGFFRQRTAEKAILIATSLPVLADLCDTVYVLEGGRARPFAEVKAGVEYFKSLQKAEAERQKLLVEAGGEPEALSSSEEPYTAFDQVAVVASDF